MKKFIFYLFIFSGTYVFGDLYEENANRNREEFLTGPIIGLIIKDSDSSNHKNNEKESDTLEACQRRNKEAWDILGKGAKEISKALLEGTFAILAIKEGNFIVAAGTTTLFVESSMEAYNDIKEAFQIFKEVRDRKKTLKSPPIKVKEFDSSCSGDVKESPQDWALKE